MFMSIVQCCTECRVQRVVISWIFCVRFGYIQYKLWIFATYNYVYMYAHMYVCLYACMYVCIYVCMYICMYIRMYLCMYVCVRGCRYVCACMCVCVCICMYVWPYFECKPTRSNISAINATFLIYVLFFRILIRGQRSSVTIVSDLPKPQRPMNRFLSPSDELKSVFINASRWALRPSEKVDPISMERIVSNVKITNLPHLGFQNINVHSHLALPCRSFSHHLK
jgi:hypothetical protein